MSQNSLMSIKETCNLLGVRESWLRSAVFKNQIPFLKLGRFVRFSREDLTKWLDSNKRNPKNAVVS